MGSSSVEAGVPLAFSASVIPRTTRAASTTTFELTNFPKSSLAPSTSVHNHSRSNTSHSSTLKTTVSSARTTSESGPEKTPLQSDPSRQNGCLGCHDHTPDTLKLVIPISVSAFAISLLVFIFFVRRYILRRRRNRTFTSGSSHKRSETTSSGISEPPGDMPIPSRDVETRCTSAELEG